MTANTFIMIQPELERIKRANFWHKDSDNDFDAEIKMNKCRRRFMIREAKKRTG